MGNRKKPRPEKDSRGGDATSGMHMVELPFSKIDRQAHRANLLQEGEQSTARFPALIAEILQLYRTVYPLHIVAAVSCGAMSHPVGPEGVSLKGLIEGVEQHHLELLLALLCMIRRSEWGMEPASPIEIQAAIDAVKALATAFHRRRLLQLPSIQDPEAGFVVGLQEQIRDHTQMVRNWGYYSDMVRISKAAHAPLDPAFAKFHGYSATELIDVADALMAVYCERLGSRFTLLQEIFRHRTRKAIVYDFFARYEGVAGDPDALLASLPRRMTLRELRMMLRAHADRWLVMEMRVEPGIVSERLGMPLDRVQRIFETLTLRPGELIGHDPEHLFLANPAWHKPGLHVDDDFIFFAPQSIMSFIWPILRGLCEAAGLKSALEKRRSQFLEDAVGDAIEAAVPGTVLHRNAKWKWQGRGYETDLLAVVDRVVLIVEAKSHVITDGGLRGGPRAIRRHIRQLLIEPAEQSARLRDVLLAARKGDAVAGVIAGQLRIDPAKVERVVRLSVTLDDFAALASAEAELKRAGWLPADLELPPTMNLAELETCIDILDGPVFFLHYLVARERIQRATPIFGYELDYLGMYLECGLELSELVSGTHTGMINGMSAAIDRYYVSRDQGFSARKPRPLMGAYLDSVIGSFQTRRAATWTIMGLALLDAIGPGRGAELDNELEALAHSVAENWFDPMHQNVFVATGPCRHSLAIFYIYPEVLEEGLIERLDTIVGSVMDGMDHDRGIVIARMLERWHRPYEIAARVEAVPNPAAEAAQ